ncbi:MAG: oxidoreductase, partial [Devosia sp.]|nr:oxidoreductase [Devosia sp.]
QGRGFFTERAGRDKTDNEELVRCWYNDKNFERRDRAIALAKELGHSPIHVALAFVLAQPFPSIPLIGPRTLGELDDSCRAFEIKLTPEQVKWLDNG